MTDYERTIKRELIDELRNVADDENFVIGVVSNAPHADDRKAIIDFIRNGENVSKKNIILLSIELDEMRKA